MVLFNDGKVTKHEIARYLATFFPDELGLRLPRKRESWTNEHSRMDIFDAVGLAVGSQMKENRASIASARMRSIAVT